MTLDDAQRAARLAEACKKTIGDEDAAVIGSVLGHLVAGFFMGFPDAEVRDEVCLRWMRMLHDLMETYETLPSKGALQ